MNSTTDKPPTDWKEARRLRAWELVQQGWKQKDVAAALGVTEGAVSQWVSRARQGGVPALRRRQASWRAAQAERPATGTIPELLTRGPGAFGFSGEVWTRGRVAQVIEREFGVSYGSSQSLPLA